MERPAKERLIGAIVLVTVAWLLIPVFLDQGAGDDRTVTRELSLPDLQSSDGGQTLRRESVSLDDERPTPDTPPVETATTLPVPGAAATSASSETPTTTPEVAVEASAAASEEAVTASTASSGAAPLPEKDTVQAGTGTTPVEPAADETPSPTPQAEAPAPAVANAGDGQLWAVQLGSFGDQANAQRLASQLRAQGLPAFLSRVSRDGRDLHRVRVGPQATRAEADAVAARISASGQAATVVRHP